MDNMISIKDVSFSYDKTEIFKHLTFDIKKCKWTTIVGLNGSGKTTLVSLINNKYDYSGNISINNKDSKISLDEVLVIDDSFDYEDIYVSELLQKYYNKKKINKIINDYGLKRMINKMVHELNDSEKIVLMFCLKLSQSSNIIIIDNLLNKLLNQDRERIIEILNKMSSNVINITTHMDDTLLGDNIIIMDKGKIVLNGTKEDVFEKNDIIKKVGLDLPFVVDLSVKLKYYGLVDRIYFNMEELIDTIWV